VIAESLAGGAGGDAAAADADCRDEQGVMLEVAAGAVLGRAVLGEHAGATCARNAAPWPTA